MNSMYNFSKYAYNNLDKNDVLNLLTSAGISSIGSGVLTGVLNRNPIPGFLLGSGMLSGGLIGGSFGSALGGPTGLYIGELLGLLGGAGLGSYLIRKELDKYGDEAFSLGKVSTNNIISEIVTEKLIKKALNMTPNKNEKINKELLDTLIKQAAISKANELLLKQARAAQAAQAAKTITINVPEFIGKAKDFLTNIYKNPNFKKWAPITAGAFGGGVTGYLIGKGSSNNDLNEQRRSFLNFNPSAILFDPSYHRGLYNIPY